MLLVILCPVLWSPPSRGAWIEITDSSADYGHSAGRPPRGGRGLKYYGHSADRWCYRRPPRGGRGLKSARIDDDMVVDGRPPRGGRGLKLIFGTLWVLLLLSPPSRGAWIEIDRVCNRSNFTPSPPSRGAWIEISNNFRKANGTRRRPPRGGRGLKCYFGGVFLVDYMMSPPSRGAWIEIDF